MLFRLGWPMTSMVLALRREIKRLFAQEHDEL
jgi:hypothetical protein